MYLFYVKEHFLSSLELNNMQELQIDDANLVQCYSGTTLLKVAQKLLPDMVIVDLDLLEDDFVHYFDTLRNLSPNTGILALVGSDDYENLAVSIDQSSIDEYLVKPVNKDDFIARVQLTSQRNIVTDEENEQEQVYQLDEAGWEDEDENEDSLGFDAESTETTVIPGEVFDKELIVEDPANEFGLDMLDDEIAPPEAVNRFTAIFGDVQPGKNKETAVTTDELMVIPELPQDHVTDNIFEAHGNDLEDLFNSRDEEIFAIEPLPDEGSDNKQETELFDEPPPLEDDFYQYQQNLKYGNSQLRKGRRTERKKSTGGRVARSFSLLGNILLVCVLIVMAFISVILILDRISESVPQVGGYQVYVIKSDYFSPEVAAGSLAIGRKADLEQINTGDIITYRSAGDPAAIAAGRIAEINRENGLRMIDVSGAVASGERQSVAPEAVIGRLIYAVPYIGYLVDYAQTREGLILLIFVPGILIIIFQISKIIKYFYGRQ